MNEHSLNPRRSSAKDETTGMNPHGSTPGYVRLARNHIHADKIYMPILSFYGGKVTLRSRRNFKTASGAVAHAKAIRARWIRIWDAAEAAA